MVECAGLPAPRFAPCLTGYRVMRQPVQESRGILRIPPKIVNLWQVLESGLASELLLRRASSATIHLERRTESRLALPFHDVFFPGLGQFVGITLVPLGEILNLVLDVVALVL